MFSHIMTPIDLAHLDRLGKALQVTADLARHYDARVTYVGVTAPQPSAVAHSPEEYAAKLGALAEREAKTHGLSRAEAHPIVAHDPAVELDGVLADTADRIGADLVVMGSHIPHRFEMPSHGGKLASHSDTSVFLVRES